MAVSHRGNVVHQRGYGVANVEDDVPFRSDTVLRLGSTTKHMCATCILLLENQGKLSLDQDIRRYVPELPDFGAEITLRHLLTMTSGLWDGINLLLFSGLNTSYPQTRDDLLKLHCSQSQLMFRPGDDCTYSNTNYSLLSLVIERVSGKSISVFMKTNLFEPLGMTNTGLTPRMSATIKRKAKGYLPTGDGQFEAGFMLTELDGNGGVDSSIDDMLKWFANYRNDRLFGPDYRERLEAESRLNDSRLLDYRLGINVTEYRGQQVVRHAGGMPGYLCDFVFFPEADLGIVTLANVMDPSILDLSNRIADIVIDEEFNQPLESAFIDATLDEVAQLVGVYASEQDGHVVELAIKDGALVCYFEGDLNPLLMRDGWMESQKNLVAVRVHDIAAGREGCLQLRLGCQALSDLSLVDDPRDIELQDTSCMDGLVGSYVHDGLKEVHDVYIADKSLRVRIPGPVRGLVWDELTPVAGDLFVALIDSEPSCTNVTVKFLRDKSGVVTGLSYSLSRCRDVFFEKENTG